jgi:hypothetical protein
MMALPNLQIVVRAMALVMAMLVAVPASGLGELLFFCTMTGEVGPKCCCQHEVEQDLVEGLSVSAVPCCEIVGSEQQVPPARVEVHTPKFETPQFAALLFKPGNHTQIHIPTRLALPHGSRGPPPDTGPPIFIKHSSYLI